MATEGISEDTKMATNANSQVEEKEIETSKDVIQKGAEIERKQDEDNGKSKNDANNKAEEVVIVEEEKNNGGETDNISSTHVIEKTTSFREESNFLSELKEHEKKAFFELRSKIEEAILGDKLLKKDHIEQVKENSLKKDGEEMEKKMESQSEGNKGKIEEKQKGKAVIEDDATVKEKVMGNEEKEKEELAIKDGIEEGNPMKEGDEEKEKIVEEGGKEEINAVMEEKVMDIDKDIALWGVPLLPSKGDKRTDVILLKFLRAREFKVNDAFEMLRNTIQWRKENNIDSILDEDLGVDLGFAAYMNGNDRNGHPVCYNIFGVFGDEEVYNRTFGTEEQRKKFLRWRIQLMEKWIQNLDFKPGGVSSFLQINDLKNTPGPSKKELRLATKQAVDVLQDNYPEFVAKNIFINVPFWYYAFTALLLPFLTQRTKSKFVYTRPARVTETLLKYIAVEEIPVHYGGLKRENDSDFSTENNAMEILVKSGSIKTIEIPAPVVGTQLIWDLTVLGWEVNYKEEFVPTNEGSYTIMVQKGRKIGWQEKSVRNSFRTNEPGNVALIIENGTFKKKRVLYRYKTKNGSS
ncbi:CRAL_TRIO domain-containing protein/CRAL_TRIO_N domain-containing protein [Cephalotus follicularis]|uniref:CRAL_TRIO domain-containing protein/CRAL_TRIO_N domain-containing protein n=1 Tax=Cephalotus follicularis TaxID=3775 RepID=A0A1Q3BZQ5_CEPFO|nr:CRAL_TRIO domain-containing protein/CRAL_TRIO_N domain-containing protein [Cephalotus follicularis]